MSATFLDLPSETLEPAVCCANCPAVQRLEGALEELRADFRREVGYWKSRHADAVKRIAQWQEELDQSRAQSRALQDKLFARKSEKSAQSNRSNDLFDAEEVAVGKSCSELTPWALGWLRRMRHLYRINRERLCHRPDSAKFQEQDALLRQAVAEIRAKAVAELSAAKLRQPCRKVLESLHWPWRCFRCWPRWRTGTSTRAAG